MGDGGWRMADGGCRMLVLLLCVHLYRKCREKKCSKKAPLDNREKRQEREFTCPHSLSLLSYPVIHFV